MDYEYHELYILLKFRKLKLWKHRPLRKLRKYLCMYKEPYNYVFIPCYLDLIELIELQKMYCYICGYDVYNLEQLKIN